MKLRALVLAGGILSSITASAEASSSGLLPLDNDRSPIPPPANVSSARRPAPLAALTGDGYRPYDYGVAGYRTRTLPRYTPRLVANAQGDVESFRTAAESAVAPGKRSLRAPDRIAWLPC